MKYILFEKSAIEAIIGKSEFQSIEFPYGKALIDYIRNGSASFTNFYVYANKNDAGIIFSGKNVTDEILVFDLEQSGLTNKVKDDDALMLIIQKTLRTAIKIWNHYPFSSSERVNESKSIVFPFVYTDKHRVVMERSPKCERLTKRGIDNPLLAYNYTDQGSSKNQAPTTEVLRDAGETYIKLKASIRRHFESLSSTESNNSAEHPLLYAKTEGPVSDGEFMYLDYENRKKRLTTTQLKVVENNNTSSPIRIEGPAGTGKTASMILRAFYLLEKKRKENIPYKIIFLSHSESTNNENRNAFSYIDGSEKYMNGDIPQQIKFTTLLKYCIETIRIKDTQVIDVDALDAKDMQRMYIEDALSEIMNSKHKTYRSLLSDNLKDLLDESKTPKGALLSMLQHEFSVQIKGRTNGTIEEYYQLDSIKNAMILDTKKDKEFVFEIFLKYQEMLSTAAVYDLDDITIETISTLNAPIWRRERKDQGFDYIFVDEMHLFNINEQYCFHYLTKSPEQKEIPICFALDYSQAIGDRGDVQQDFIEKNFENADENNFKTVFRSSQYITDFCASISAAGALMFQNNYKNPYGTAMSGFTENEENLCQKPSMLLYSDDIQMIKSLKEHIDKCKKDFACKNNDIALISFDDKIFESEQINILSKSINKKIKVINNRQASMETKDADDLIPLFDPYNINGLEFKCVILIGVDEGRVPQNVGVNDISENYLKYSAFNQLYLASSRAKFRLILLGNKLHGVSSCLQYSIENDMIECQEI